MTGPHDSILGMEKAPIVQRFHDALPVRFNVAEGDVQMNAVLLDIDEASGRARAIERLNFRID
jgi:calcineurin-like phosphoesterase